MPATTFLLLGGYGNTGRALSRLLLQETNARLVIAGRSLEKAAQAATVLNQTGGEQRASAAAVDASNRDSLMRAFQGVDMVVVASSTARYAGLVARAALDAGIDYLDIQYSTQKVAALFSLAGEIERSGRCFITDGGFHPGLPAALIAYGARRFDTLTTARVASVIRQDWAALNLPEETLIELVEELVDFTPVEFKQGRWQKASLLSSFRYITVDFGPPFEKQACVPMFLEEMRRIPEDNPAIQDTGFFVGGFNWFVDWLVMPLGMAAMWIAPRAVVRPLARIMRWGLNAFSKPPFGMVLQLDAQGSKDGQPVDLRISLCHPDGYLFTAIPVAACLLQYLDGSIRKPGLWMQANLVEPARLVKDMQRMGVEVIETGQSNFFRLDNPKREDA